VNHVCFSPDGQRILGVGNEGKARLWSLRTGDIVLKMQKGSGGLRSAAFGQEGAVVVASSGDEFKVNRWDLQTGERQRCFIGYAQKHPRVKETFVSPNGCGLLALSHRDEYGPRERTDAPNPFMGPVSLAAARVVGAPLVGLAWTTWFAAKAAGNVANSMQSPTGGSYFFEFWDVVSETGVQAVALGPDPPLAVAYSADGHRVLAGFDDGYAYLFSL
jgi:WD40 repeat protein